MGPAYYNEIEPFAADWLENLIAQKRITSGKVDRRSIADVRAEDVAGFQRCHFFAGIAGWDLALSLAGWDGPVWTASCPCQPFSSAGKQKGTQDERHLWPVQFGLVDAVRPPIVFGEQVSSAIGHGWLDGVFADLEGAGYTCGAAVLGAHSVGAPHIRQRLYWFGCRLEFANSIRQRGERIEIGRTGEAARTSQGTLRQCKCNNEGESNDDPESNIQCDSGDCRRDSVERLSDSTSSRREGAGERPASGERESADAQRRFSVGQSSADGSGIFDANINRCGPWESSTPANGHRDIADSAGSGIRNSAGVDEQWTRGLRQVASCEDRGPDSGIYRFSAWSHFTIGRFRDGKSRRIGCGVLTLVNGLPAGMGRIEPGLFGILEDEVVNYAKNSQANPTEVMRDLWDYIDSKTIQRRPGRLLSIHSPEVLLSFLLQLAEQGREVGNQDESGRPKIDWGKLRVLWINHESACSPCERGLVRQPSGEYPNSLRELSSLMALAASRSWSSAFIENAAVISPLTNSLPGNRTSKDETQLRRRASGNRKGRLKGYGNAIVPKVAALFIRAVMDWMEEAT